MKAKDTVKKTNPYNPNSEEQAERLCWAAYEDGKNDQAEISFKAGIKEVVDWVGKHSEGGFFPNWHGIQPEYHYWYFYPNEWQAKLKEWGIKEEK